MPFRDCILARDVSELEFHDVYKLIVYQGVRKTCSSVRYLRTWAKHVSELEFHDVYSFVVNQGVWKTCSAVRHTRTWARDVSE